MLGTSPHRADSRKGKSREPPSISYTSLPGPLGPKFKKKSEKRSPGPSGQGSGKSLERCLFGFFAGFFGASGLLSGFLAVSGRREGPRDSCSSSEISQGPRHEFLYVLFFSRASAYVINFKTKPLG